MRELMRPATFGEAWLGAPIHRRRWLLLALGVFAFCTCIWLLGWVVPAHTIPDHVLGVLAWLPLVGGVIGGIALSALMLYAVPAPIETPVGAVVKAWARVVHGLSRSDLDEFEAELALLPPSLNVEKVSEASELSVSKLVGDGTMSTSELVASILATDPRWHTPLLAALRAVVAQESAGVSKRRYSERVRAADRAVRRRARWSPALLAAALLVIFAGPIGSSILAAWGLQPEWRLGTGALVGLLDGAIAAWLGVQWSAVPDNSTTERLRSIANSLGATSERWS